MFFFWVQISKNVCKCDSPRSTWVVCTRPGLAWLTSPRIGLARLACTSRQQPGRLRRPGGAERRCCCCEVQARRARPRRGEVSQASQGLVHTTHVLLGLSRLETCLEICSLKKRHCLLFFERNPLPGSDSARHLEPDALILARFGAVRGQISHKTFFWKIGCHILTQNVPRPDCSW